MKSRNGFTLIELMTVTVVIAVLATISTISFARQQITARDTSRSVKAALVANVLEKYYDKTGGYPSPLKLVNSNPANTGDAVSTLLGIETKDKNTLIMPNAPSGTTNSIASALGTADVFAYTASSIVGSDNCQVNPDSRCDEFVLSYKKEIDGSTVTVNSTNHRPTETDTYDVPLTAPSQPTIATTQSGTNLVATSSVPACAATYSPRYSFRTQVAAGAWSTWSGWQVGAAYTKGGNTNVTNYSFQVRVRCESGASVSDTSVASTSGTITYYEPPAAPAAPTTTSAAYGSYGAGTSGTVTCNLGSAEYRIDWSINGGAWGIGPWSTTMTSSQSSTEGSRYDFRSTARCVNGTQTTQGATGAADTYIDPIDPPASPIVSGATFAAKTWTWSPATCPAGTFANYQYAFRTYTGIWTAGGWVNVWTGTSATNSGATSQGLAYDTIVQQGCSSAYTSSGWSPSATGGFFYAPVVHARAEYWALRLDAGAYPRVKIKTFDIACASGLSRELFLRVSWNNAAWVNANSGTWYSAPDNVEVLVTDQTVPSGQMVEFGTRVRCRHPGTNYATDGQSTPMTYDVQLYDVGNLYNKGSSTYASTCPAMSGQSSYCAGGYDTNDVKNSTNSTLLACNLKPTGISGTTTNWSDRYAFGTASLCWL